MQVEVNNNLTWEPHKVQQEVVKLPFDIFEALYGGAAGGGKSELLVMLPLVYGWTQRSRFKGIILRRTMPELEKEIILRADPWYRNSGGVYNEQKKRWKWPASGAIMQFGHAEKEQSIRIYDGIEYNYIGWDEATSFTKFQYEYLFSRARSSDPTLPSIIRGATNPGGIGHDYFRKRFVEPCRVGFRILREKLKVFGKEEIMYRIYVPCLAKDNPHLMVNDPMYLAKLSMISSEAERRAKLEGDWWTFEGQVFKEFRAEQFEDEPENALHVIDRFEIPSWWPRVLAIDWGFAANTSIGWGALSPDKRLYIYRTYNQKAKYIKEWCRDAIALSGKEPIKDVVICHSAGQQKGEPLTIQYQVQEAFDEAGFEVMVRLGERDRVGGKLLVHEYLRWKPKPRLVEIIGNFDQKLAEHIFRMYGHAKYQEYMSMFVPEQPETNIPRLQIFTDSPEGVSNQDLIDAIGNCQYDDKDIEDVKEFSGDDPYDMIRMLLSSSEYYISNFGGQDLTYNNHVTEAVKQLKETNDQTAFYRRMEHLEGVKKQNLSVRRSRYRRRGM